MTEVKVKTAMVPVADIKILDDHNPRKRFDEDALAELVNSIQQRGTLLQSITVSEADNGGGYTLVAGERRLRAARLADLHEVPVVIRPRETALADALAENLIRRDLDPIEAANGLSRLAKAEKLKNRKAIAKRVGKSENWVSERLRLLELPEGVQLHIAAGDVPIAAERELRAAAKIAPRVAQCACELVATGKIDGRDLVERFGEVLVAMCDVEFDPPLPIVHLTATWGQTVRLSELLAPGETRDGLMARVQATTTEYGSPITSDDPSVSVLDEHLDAARAAGVLIEHTQKGRRSDVKRAFLVDAEFGAHLAELIVEAAESSHAAREAARSDTSPTASGASEDSKEHNRRKREQRDADAAKARRHNGRLGQRIVSARIVPTRRERALDRARALALMILNDNPNLPAQGLRLVLADLQDEEVKTLKSGKVRRKQVYAEPEECLEFVRGRISRAKTANEVLEIMAEVLIAYELADERELPQSRRACHRQGHGGMSAAIDALAADMKAAKSGKAK